MSAKHIYSYQRGRPDRLDQEAPLGLYDLASLLGKKKKNTYENKRFMRTMTAGASVLCADEGRSCLVTHELNT